MILGLWFVLMVGVNIMVRIRVKYEINLYTEVHIIFFPPIPKIYLFFPPNPIII